MRDPFLHAYCDRPEASVVRRAAAIRLLVLDVDGVLTDGTVYVGRNGEDFKPFHVHDGKGLALLRDAGLPVAIITARRSEALAYRARELGVTDLRQGARDKGAELDELARAHGVEGEAIAYVGDDLVDLLAFRRAGLAIAVANAHPLVAHSAHWRTRRAGGAGAVREVCELLLAAQGRLEDCFRGHG